MGKSGKPKKKIVVVGSVELADKLVDIAEKLEIAGFETEVPHIVNRIKKGEFTLEEFKQWKKESGGDISFRKKSKVDYIKRYFNLIKESDAILVVNFDKNGVSNYIGGNALMELGFAYVLEKPIFLFNPIPKMQYTDEILAVDPIVINGDLSKIAVNLNHTFGDKSGI